MGNFRDLQVWQRSRELAVLVDRETRRLRRGHSALADQLRRASLSIPTNLAEGCSKAGDSEFLRFIEIAIGSAAEVDSLLAHLTSLGVLERSRTDLLCQEITIIRKMLFKLRRAMLTYHRHEQQPPATHHPPPATG
jgi:four helix bundle protein